MLSFGLVFCPLPLSLFVPGEEGLDVGDGNLADACLGAFFGAFGFFNFYFSNFGALDFFNLFNSSGFWRGGSYRGT